jgi:hypothetical protein
MPAIYNQREKALTSGAFFCKEVKRVKEMVVKGKVVDGMTRCIHSIFVIRKRRIIRSFAGRSAICMKKRSSAVCAGMK